MTILSGKEKLFANEEENCVDFQLLILSHVSMLAKIPNFWR